MTSKLRKLALTARIICSFDGLVALAAYLARAVSGLIRTEGERIWAASPSMDLSGGP